MFYAKAKKEALNTHKKAVEKYNQSYEKTQSVGKNLYATRKNSIKLIQNIEDLINSIANSPKEFVPQLASIHAERMKFRQTEEYAEQAHTAHVKSGIGVAAGVAGGVAVASVAPTAAMWAATTFGTASTGTAISALHGAAATQAALAWLGGGTIASGAGGVVAGKALLALAGPIGWGIAGITATTSAIFLAEKNKQIAENAISQAKKISIAREKLDEMCEEIHDLREETIQLEYRLRVAFKELENLKDADYLSLNEEQRLKLGAIANSTLSLAVMLNRTIDAVE